MPTHTPPDSASFDDDAHPSGTAFTDPSASAQGLGWQLQRWLLVLAVLGCTAALLASLWMPQRLGPLAFGAMLGGYGVLALAGLAGLRMPPRRAPLLRLLLLGGASALVGLSGWAGGWALAEPGLPLLVVAVCLVASGSRRTMAVLATLPALATVAWLGWCQFQATAASDPLPPLPVHLLMLAAAVLAAAAAGRAVARTQEAQEALAARHATRLDAMLAMAVDTHWETDASLRFTVFRRRGRDGRMNDMRECLGRRPWDLPLLAMDEDTADLLRADTDAHEKLHQLAVSWRCSDGQRRHYLVSGEPRSDAQGQHSGYWGVAVDVSAERAALASAADSQARHLALVQDLPVALVLHRHGDILDANPAAARLLGYRSPSAMRGHNLLAEHMDEDQRELALDRLEDLEAEPDLDSLPVVPRRLRQRSGEPVYTLALALRSDEGGRPASLAVYLDQSAHHAAEALLLQHEALLTRLLNTSHDVILLTDLDHDRVLLANDTAARLTGLDRGQLVGQALSRLPLWPDAHSLDEALQQLRQDGLVPGLVLAARAADGRALTLRLSATQLPQGELNCALLVLQDLTELTRLQHLPAPAAAEPDPADAATQPTSATEPAAAAARAALLAQTSQLLHPPVNQLLAHWRQLHQPRQSAVQQAHNLAQAGDSVQALARVVNDLVDLSRLQAGQLPVQTSALSLSALLAELTEVFAPAAQARGLTLNLHTDPLLPAWQLGDAARLRQLLVALLHQALAQAEPAPGATALRLAVAALPDGHTRISLWAPGLTARLDPPFGSSTSADAAQATRQLALDLARQLAHAMGGRLSAQPDSGQAQPEGSDAPASVAWVLALPLPPASAPPPVTAATPRAAATTMPPPAAAPTPTRAPTPTPPPAPLPTPEAEGGAAPLAVPAAAPGEESATSASPHAPVVPADVEAAAQANPPHPTGPGALTTDEGEVAEVAEAAQTAQAAQTPQTLQTAQAAQAAQVAQLLHGARVLLVEDNQINRLVVQAVLEDWGLQVAPASSAAQALALGAQAVADQRPFELALVSLQLPGLGAADLIQRLHRQVPAERLPVLGLADQPPPDGLLASPAAAPRVPPGMVAVLGRPLTAAPLRATLLQALAQGRGLVAPVSPG